MTWTNWFDRLPDEIKLFVSEGILEKNKEIKPIEKITNSRNVKVKDNINEQARAFRELVKKSEEVKGK